MKKFIVTETQRKYVLTEKVTINGQTTPITVKGTLNLPAGTFATDGKLTTKHVDPYNSQVTDATMALHESMIAAMNQFLMKESADYLGEREPDEISHVDAQGRKHVQGRMFLGTESEADGGADDEKEEEEGGDKYNTIPEVEGYYEQVEEKKDTPFKAKKPAGKTLKSALKGNQAPV